jgi:hypothetical protein
MNNIFKFSPVASSKFSEELLEATTINYCPPLDRNTRTELTGLSREEIEKFLPSVIGVNSTNSDFLQKVEEYYREFSEGIPYKGKNLDASLDSNGMPVKPIEYLLYRIVEKDKTVAKDEDISSADGQFFTYKLESISNLKQKQEDTFNVIKESTIAYTKLVSSEDTEPKLRQLKSIVLLNRQLLELGIDEVNDASRITTEIHLKTVQEKNPQAIIDALEDKDLAYKAYIELFLDYGLVSLEGDEIHFEGSKLSSNKKALIGVLRSNNTVYATLIGRLRKQLGVNNLIKPETVEGT